MTKLVPRSMSRWRRVQDNWNDYQNAGGIPGVMRVEERVSERFTTQAKRLSSAYHEITSSARTYQLLQVTPSAEWQSLQEEIVNEVQRQRRWLQDLNIVLEPACCGRSWLCYPDAGAIAMGTVYYRSKKGLNRLSGRITARRASRS